MGCGAALTEGDLLDIGIDIYKFNYLHVNPSAQHPNPPNPHHPDPRLLI